MKTIISTISILAASAMMATAQLIAGFAGGNDVSGGPGTLGYSFTVGQASLTIRSLGVWESSGGSGLFNSHKVGIWDTSTQHNLLGSVTIPQTGATKISDFWYVNLSVPLTLQAGGTYLIGAQYADNDFDLSRANATAVTIASGITLGDAYLSSGTGFTFPDLDVSGANKGFFGPNAGFVPVPEPVSVMIASGLLLAFAAWRKFDKRAV